MEGFHEHRYLQLERLRRFSRTMFHSKDLTAIPADIKMDKMMNGCAVYMIYCLAATSFKKQVSCLASSLS